jgi:hypothetical protein
MATMLPSYIRATVADPKGAATADLETTIALYDEEVSAEAFELVSEEYARRTHDDSRLGTMEPTSSNGHSRVHPRHRLCPDRNPDPRLRPVHGR